MAQDFQTRAEALYRSAVREIQSAGVELDPMEFARLWMGARESIETGHDGPPTLLSPDVTVADAVVLHAPTVGCLLWWETYGAPAFAEKPREEVIGLAWMLAHAGDADLFRRLSKPAAVLRAVKAWAWEIPWHVTPADLAWGVSAVLGAPDVPLTARVQAEPSSAGWGELVAGVAHEYHLSPDEIAWRLPTSRVREMIKVANRRNGNTGADASSTEAFMAFRAYVRELKARAPAATETPDG